MRLTTGDMRKDMAKGVETRRSIGDVKDIVVSAHIYRFIRIQAPKPSHQPSSMQAPLPPTSTPPLASQRRPRSIHHLLYPPSRSIVAHRRKTTTTTARQYRPQCPFSIHHLKQNHGGLYPAPQIPYGIRSFLRIPAESAGIKFGRDFSQI